MSEYGAFIWPAYGFAGVTLAFLFCQSISQYRTAKQLYLRLNQSSSQSEAQ